MLPFLVLQPPISLLLPSLFSRRLFFPSLLHGISLNEDHKRSSCLEKEIQDDNAIVTIKHCLGLCTASSTRLENIMLSYPLKFVVLSFPPFFVSVSSLCSASPSIFVHRDFLRERVCYSNNRQFPLYTNFKTRQGVANKSPQLERAY